MEKKQHLTVVGMMMVGLALLVGCTSSGKDFSEYCDTAFSDVVSEIVVGYKCHWDEFSPENVGISDVFGYESPFGGFVQQDINGDGMEELLIGDDFGDGNYQLYDIFAFDKKNGQLVHLLSGGERDWFQISSDGMIVEMGSNGADDSFCKQYVLKGAELKEMEAVKDVAVKIVTLDRFLRYVAPTAYVAVRDGDVLGMLVKTFDDSYVIEAQDTCRISKRSVDIELWSAYDGKGVVFLKEPGTSVVYENPDVDSAVLGTMMYEEGYVPETYTCLGYEPGWLKVSLDGKAGYVQETLVDWDFVCRF